MLGAFMTTKCSLVTLFVVWVTGESDYFYLSEARERSPR